MKEKLKLHYRPLISPHYQQAKKTINCDEAVRKVETCSKREGMEIEKEIQLDGKPSFFCLGW